MDSLFAIVWAIVMGWLGIDDDPLDGSDEIIAAKLLEDEDLEKVCGSRLENDRTDHKAVT